MHHLDSSKYLPEQNKQRLSWLALRTARDKYLHHFGKIGNGDVLLLAQEIEKEKERVQRGESQPATGESTTDGGMTPSATTVLIAAGQPESSFQKVSLAEDNPIVPLDESKAGQETEVPDIVMDEAKTQAQPEQPKVKRVETAPAAS